MLSCMLLACNVQEGYASYYSVRSNGGTHTASGEKLSDKDLTAAHPKLPFGTVLKVTNLENDKHVIVRVNNRGPFATNKRGRAIFPLKPHPSRIVDLSKAAAKQLDFIQDGIVKVQIEIIDA
jgi:rare lipoprotein A